MDTAELLSLIYEANKMARDDTRAIMENHLDESDRVIANISMLATIEDGSRLLSVALSDPGALAELARANPTS